ncbi:hypothetical protein L204_104137 [Cryptococcus depauperatus]|nr:hypothetical protein L204_03289 [Cryptococcus depauperatus CBS 7855]
MTPEQLAALLSAFSTHAGTQNPTTRTATGQYGYPNFFRTTATGPTQTNQTWNPAGNSYGLGFGPASAFQSNRDPGNNNSFQERFSFAYNTFAQAIPGLGPNQLVELTLRKMDEYPGNTTGRANPSGVGPERSGMFSYPSGAPTAPTATAAPTNGTHGPVYEDPNERPFWEEAYKRERATGKVTTNADIRSALLEGLTSDAVHRYESVTQEIKNTTNAIQANEGDCRSWRRSVVDSLRHIIRMCENDTTPAADDIRKLTNDWEKYIETQSKWDESVNKLIQLQTSLESHVKDYRTLGDEYRTGNTTGVSFARANKLFSDFNERRRPLTDQTGDLQTAWKELSRQQRGFTDLPATGASRGSLLEMLSTLLGLQHR